MVTMRRIAQRLIVLFSLSTERVTSFSPLPPALQSPTIITFRRRGHWNVRYAAPPPKDDNNNNKESSIISDRNDDDECCWNPGLRKTMGFVASVGALDTGYLTFNKLVMGKTDIALCGTSGACSNVLNGPYANIPGTEIPLSLVGFVCYLLVIFLAIAPTTKTTNVDEDWNRVLLAATSSAMGFFSIFLLYILLGVLHENCPFCLLSAGCSLSLATISWFAGLVPPKMQGPGLQWGGIVAAVLTASTIIFSNVDAAPADAVAQTNFAGTPVPSSTTTIASSSNSNKKQQEKPQLFTPPPIETTSSAQAVSLAKELEALDAKMYGAYWCSHCFDQKSQFGKEAFARITYLECAKDGVNSQTKACRARDVPGYPTWEISGKLYPGEQALEELEEIVQNIKAGSS